MTYSIKVRTKAHIDIDDCFLYIAQNNEDAAFRFFDAVRSTFADLGRMPRMGKRYQHPDRSELNLRQWQVKGFRAYLIIYQVHASEIEIIRVIPASRNIEQILKNE